MAIDIQRKFSIDLSGTVADSIAAVRAVRRQEQSRKNAEFQRAIANGLSYGEQLVLLQKQLVDERKSTLSDSSFIAALEKDIADTKKLNRFNRYRATYSKSLGSLNAGKINEEQYLNTLKNQLDAVTDPDLRLEILQNITDAETKVKEYRDTILGNQVRKAKFDGTSDALESAVSRVNAARAEALINGIEDDVTTYDETLSALNSQLAGIRIQDSLTDFQVASATRGTNPIEKLDYINSQIRLSDSEVPVRIGNVSFTSAQQFWSLERDGYLAGGSEIFGDFFGGLKDELEGSIAVDATIHGAPTQGILDEAMSRFNELRVKPGMEPYLSFLDTAQASVMAKAVDTYARSLIDLAETTLQFDFVGRQIQNLGARYNVNTQVYSAELFQKIRGFEQSKLLPEGTSDAFAATSGFNIPEIGDRAKPKVGDPIPGTDLKFEEADIANLEDVPPPTTATPSPTIPGAPVTPKVGDPIPGTDLKFEEADITNRGDTVPPATPTPTPAPTTPQVGDPIPGTDLKFEAADIANRGDTTPAPVTPTAVYTGSSIVDYLKSVKLDSSIQSRAKIAQEQGISFNIDATGKESAKQNTELLKRLRG